MAKLAAFVFVLFAALALIRVRALNMTRLTIPTLKPDQKEASLECRYRIEDKEFLEAVKWYKDGKLILSCLPHGGYQHAPTVQGVHIPSHGMTPMGNCDLKLADITKESLGEYKCEVSLINPPANASLTVISSVQNVQITLLYVPGGASHEAPLECRYNLTNEQLYDVKWYKDGREFFRCLPSGETKTFSVEGVKVMDSGYATTGSCGLTLMMLSWKSTGRYTCEVGTEGPNFKSVSKSSLLRLIESNKQTRQKEKENETYHHAGGGRMDYKFALVVCAVRFMNFIF